MSVRAIYIRLTPRERQLLEAMANEDRRLTHDQAAHLVSKALHEWSLQKAFEEQFSPDADVSPTRAIA